jgi:hypothetical protein
MTKNVRVWRTPGNAMSFSPWIRHVTDADFQEVVEVAGHQMAVEHEFKFRHRPFEVCEALRRRAVQHDADHDERAAIDFSGVDDRAHLRDIALLQQPLRSPVASRRADVNRLRELRI